MLKAICDRCKKDINSEKYYKISISEQTITLDNAGQYKLTTYHHNSYHPNHKSLPMTYCDDCLQDIKKVMYND